MLKTRKMSIDEYRLGKEKQFGSAYPPMDAKCLYCGHTYGEHYGLECPNEKDMLTGWKEA